MKTLGYFTKPELVKLLVLLEQEGIQVEVAFDSNFARLYRNTFGIKPVLHRASSFKMPQMGWYILFRDEDEVKLRHVVLNSSFAHCLKKPEAANYPRSDVIEKRDRKLRGNRCLSYARLRWLLLLLVLIAISLYLLNKI
jgi:hypothetical protein